MRLSIITPCLTRIDLLEATLVSVLQHRPVECEVVVAHRGNYLDPYDLSDEVQFVQAPSHCGLVELFQHALQHATGDVVHLLTGGVEVCEGWTDRVLPHFQDDQVGSVVPLILTSEDTSRVHSLGVDRDWTWSRRLVGHGVPNRQTQLDRLAAVGPTTIAAFYRRSALEQMGGATQQLGDRQMDLDLALRLQRSGYQSAIETSCSLVADEVDLPKESAWKSGRVAQRMIRRYGRSRVASTWLSTAGLVTDLATTLWNPVQAPKIFGRIATWFESGAAYRLSAPESSVVEQEKPAIRLHQPQEVSTAADSPRKAA